MRQIVFLFFTVFGVCFAVIYKLFFDGKDERK